MTSVNEAFAPTERASRIVWRACADQQAWIDAAVQYAGKVLHSALERTDSPWLLLSGGTTPAPIYSAFAAQSLDWSRVIVSLVDDRDVDPGADGSNERLVRETLLRGRAAAARFQPLHTAGQSLDDAVRMSNESWLRDTMGRLHGGVALAMLGMGDDGHTASLFPGASNLDAAFASLEPYIAIDATGCPVAGNWPQRISLTPAGLVQAQQCMLLIRGDEKRAAFERALAAGDARDMPIRVAIDMTGAPLQIFWCP